MRLDKISLYQAAEIPLPDKKINAHTISEEVFPGVEIDLTDHLVKISHIDWPEDIFVSTANVRYATRRKDVVIKIQEVEPVKEVKIVTRVSKSHRPDTKKTKKDV